MINEDQLESITLDIFKELGYEVLNGYDIERDYSSVFMDEDLIEDLLNINEDFELEEIKEAIRVIKNLNQINILEANKEFTKYLLEGVPVMVKLVSGYIYKSVKLIDFDNINKNHFQAINQFTIVEHSEKRPDIIIFINGIPLCVIELKTMSNEDVKLEDAYNQLMGYKNVHIPELFKYNQLLAISDGVCAKAGTITSNYSRFNEWKKIKDSDEVIESMPTHETLFYGMFKKNRLLELINKYILFSNDAKILPAYHQYFGVKKAITSTMKSTNGKAGILWHTQGSGKSFSMVFYVGNIIKELNNPTILVVTDRNDLDNQLYETFIKCETYLKQRAVQADSRDDLKELLKDRSTGGIFFTTLQKFEEESGLFSNRDDILVLVDECHRSHYGLEATIKLDTEAMIASKKYGTAKYLHDALPNAKYIGFTGTPVETRDKSTSSIFGNIIDAYDMTQAIMDGSTVPITYEARMAKVGLNQKMLEEIDNLYNFFEENEIATPENIGKSKQQMASISQIIEDKERLTLIVKDIIKHYSDRETLVADHAMIVAYSRKSAYQMYKLFLELMPSWKDKIHMIITPSNKDEVDMQKAIGTANNKKDLELRFKNEKQDLNEPFKIAIVVDMWLTGFDVPSLGTMYIDKPMKAHNLMQAIARVNRVYKDKQGGLIVDYIGLKKWLLAALKTYTARDQNQVVDSKELLNALIDKLDIIKNLFYGFEYKNFINLDNREKYKQIKDGANFILSSEDLKKRFLNHSLDLKNLFTLCSGELDDNIKNDILYFISVKSFISKINGINKMDITEINTAVGAYLDQAIEQDELVNLEDLAETKSIDLLSDQIINKLKKMKEKNIVAEVLARAIKSVISDISKVNLVLQEKFSIKFNKIAETYNERRDSADVEKVLEELLNLKVEIEEELTKGSEYGLSVEEKAFFDSLGKDPEIKALMQDEILVKIAKELVEIINDNLTLDAFKREDARARIRVEIRKLLIKYNYPPNKQIGAVETVIKQAELRYVD